MSANDELTNMHDHSAMADGSRNFPNKQQQRPHHVAEWAEFRGLTQADISRGVGADKSVVSRWFSGSTPSEDY